MKMKESMTPLKEHNNSPETDFHMKKTYELAKKELPIMILRKLNEMQENMDVQFKDSRKTMHSMKKKFN